jgi:uncharacterized YkwD family protein
VIFLKRILTIVALVFCLCIVEVMAQPKLSEAYTAQKIAITSKSTISQQEAEVVRLVNVKRVQNGLQPLKANSQLMSVARQKSQDMAKKKYFSHVSPTFGTTFKLMERLGIRFSAAGENIAYGQKTPAAVMNAWMNSPGHRANILSKTYTNIGVGLAKNSKGVCYWTQVFTKPLK